MNGVHLCPGAVRHYCIQNAIDLDDEAAFHADLAAEAERFRGREMRRQFDPTAHYREMVRTRNRAAFWRSAARKAEG